MTIKKRLSELADCNIKDEKLRFIVRLGLYEDAFYICPASQKHHHCYEGGLAVHTLEVVENCLLAPLPNINPECFDRESLVAAAFLHDIFKTKEYVKLGGIWTKTSYADQIGHIVGAYEWFTNLAQSKSLCPEKTLLIGHCILSHHGKKEWGSPVVPQTEEADILHAADMESATFGPNKNYPPEDH